MRFLRAVIAIAVLALVLWSVAFVRHAEQRLGTLPTMVHQELAAEGSRYVPLSAIPLSLQEATVSVEDRSFWTNIGISFEGIGRAALVDISTLSFAQGGSTITQELIRDQLLSLRKTIGRKLTGIIYALLLTQRMSKATILTLYLNEVNYGAGAYGVDAAAKVYFGLAPTQLDLAQSALLAGLPQDPVALNPLVHLEAARERQNVVLDAMVSTGDISSSAAHAAAVAPLGLVH